MSPRTGAQNGNIIMTGDSEQLVSDLFHELSQPLTTLSCCLETLLKRIGTTSPNRRDMRIALEQAGKIIKLIADLRELVEGEGGGNASHKPSSDQCPNSRKRKMTPRASQEPAQPLAWPSRCCG